MYYSKTDEFLSLKRPIPKKLQLYSSEVYTVCFIKKDSLVGSKPLSCFEIKGSKPKNYLSNIKRPSTTLGVTQSDGKVKISFSEEMYKESLKDFVA
jgi:hypothetical protein